MAEKARIIEVSQLDQTVLVTFSDGRITTLDSDYVYAQSVEAPPDPDEVLTEL